jgi:hypothetical protein
MPAETKPAASATPLDLIFGLRYQTDYNSRGISESNRRGSFQVYTELQLLRNMLYLGFATEQVDLPTRPAMEQDSAPVFGPKSARSGLISDFSITTIRASTELLMIALAPPTARETQISSNSWAR